MKLTKKHIKSIVIAFIFTAVLLLGPSISPFVALGAESPEGTPALESTPAPGSTPAPESTPVPDSTPVPESTPIALPSYSIWIDANTSIELKVVNGVVAEAKSYNDDGAKVLLAANVLTLNPNDAVRKLTQQLVTEGSISKTDTKPLLIITVSGENTASGLTDELTESAKVVLKELEIPCEVKVKAVTQDSTTAAESLGLSVGRYMILNYIATEESITIQEAITKYGALKIEELMDLFDDIKDIFKDDEKNSDELTPEQKSIVDPAFEVLKQEIKLAEKTFHENFKVIKETYKNEIKNLCKEFKKGDKDAFIAKLALLKERMLADRKNAINILKDAIAAAKAKFTLAVSSAAIPEKILNKYLNWHANKAIDPEGDFKGFLQEFNANRYKKYFDKMVDDNKNDDKKRDDKKNDDRNNNGKGNDEKGDKYKKNDNWNNDDNEDDDQKGDKYKSDDHKDDGKRNDNKKDHDD